MATQAQLNANRANAQKSTGPKTAAAKARTSQNAFKTGLFAEAQIAKNENPEELAKLAAEYYEHHQPATPEARDLLDDIIQDVWRKRRLRRAETQYWDFAPKLAMNRSDEFPLGQALHMGNEQLARAERMIESVSRRFLRNLDKLHELESHPPEPAPEPEPVSAAAPADSPESSTAQPTEASAVNPEIGFVPSTAPGTSPQPSPTMPDSAPTAC